MEDTSASGRLAAARRAFEEGDAVRALAITDDASHLDDEPDRYELHRLGVLAAHRLGRTADAFARAEELLARSPVLGTPGAVADAATIVAFLADQLGKPALAVERTALALDMLAEVGHDDPALPRASNNVANSLMRLGADRLAAEILELARTLDLDDSTHVVIDINLALAEVRIADESSGQIGRTERNERLERALSLTTPYLRDARPRRSVEAAIVAAGALLELDRCIEAAHVLDAAADAATHVTDPRVRCDMATVTSRVDRGLGRLDGLLATADDAVTAAGEVDDPMLLATALRERSLAREVHGDIAGALADVRGADRLHLVHHNGRYDPLLRQAQQRAALRASGRRDQARVDSLEAAVQTLRELVHRDHLTGLPNRRAFDVDVDDLGAGGVGVIVIDLDHFKAINDRRGHLTGDAVLQRVARTIAAAAGAGSSAYRWGGEEFLVVVRENESRTSPRSVAEQVRASVAAVPWHSVAPGLAVTVSAGVATGPGAAVYELLDHADAALYRAKEAGRNRIEVSESARVAARG